MGNFDLPIESIMDIVPALATGAGYVWVFGSFGFWPSILQALGAALF
ncbi:MAG: hypothetical protein ACRCSF_03710 [Mycobacteriaceae bacterium]